MCAAIYRSNFWQRLKLFSSSQFAQLQTCITHFSILDPIAPSWSKEIFNEKRKCFTFTGLQSDGGSLPGKLTWQSWTCTRTSPPPPRCPRSWSFSSRSRSWTIVNCWLAFELLGKSPVDFAVLAANRLDRVWAIVGTGEGTETEIERTFHQAAGNDPRISTPTHCQELTQELLAKNIKREPYSLSPNGC